MAKVKLSKNKNAKEVLESAFQKDVSPLKDMDARAQVVEFISTVLKTDNDNLIYKVSVDDLEKQHWMRNEHFTKVFEFEFDHLAEYYSLSRNDRHFLKDLGKYLMWQTNLLVDTKDNPLNQKQIAEGLELSPRTVQRSMKSLEERNIIHKIQVGSEAFYIVNPYVMFKGKDINLSIPRLFDELGYINSNLVDKKNSRSNRKKEQEKRIITNN
jgi:predicted transcriptional regulator